MSAGITLAEAASVVGIASGVTSIAKSMGGGGGTGSAGTAADPFSKYRSGAAVDLANLLQHPEIAITQPGYQQQLQMGTQAQEAAAAKSGLVSSGAEKAALGQLGQSTFSSYYNSMLANLMQMSGAAQNPAAGQQAAQQAANAQQSRMMGGLQTLTSGVGSLQQAYNAANPAYNPSNFYAPTSASYSYDAAAGQI